MDRLEQIKLVEMLQDYVTYHEDKANYYNDWMIEEELKLKTIGFVTTENVLREGIPYTVISSDRKTIEETW